jgi:hypothetical protein
MIHFRNGNYFVEQISNHAKQDDSGWATQSLSGNDFLLNFRQGEGCESKFERKDYF